MTASVNLLHRLPRALHTLATPPAGAGWNLPELIDLLPDQGASLRPAAVLVGLVDRGDGIQVLLTRRTEALRHHAGQISFPGGRIEGTDASPIAAALREAHEEVGLHPLDVEPLGYLDPFVTITGFHVFPVVARVAPSFSPVIDPSEVAEAFEAPFDFLMAPDNERRFEVDYRGGKRTLVEFLFNEHRIWGATAAMLVNFRDRLQHA